MSIDNLEIPRIGDILRDEFLDPLNITAYRLAKDLQVATSTILDILSNKRKLTVDMALRLSRYFGTSSRFWLNLQTDLDIREAGKRLENELSRIPEIKTAGKR